MTSRKKKRRKCAASVNFSTCAIANLIIKIELSHTTFIRRSEFLSQTQLFIRQEVYNDEHRVDIVKVMPPLQQSNFHSDVAKLYLYLLFINMRLAVVD